MKSSSRQAGATTVEFALVAILFFAFLFGVLDLSRMLFNWNAMTEATRAGARYAAVCEDGTGGAAAVIARMQALMPEIAAANVNVVWSPAACTSSTCEGVTVSLSGVNFRYVSPLGGLSALADVAMPAFTTYLTREVMGQDPYSCITAL